jgi:hypothetical protein
MWNTLIMKRFSRNKIVMNRGICTDQQILINFEGVLNCYPGFYLVFLGVRSLMFLS